MSTTTAETRTAALFENLPTGFVLWFKPSIGRTGWEPVAICETEREAVDYDCDRAKKRFLEILGPSGLHLQDHPYGNSRGVR